MMHEARSDASLSRYMECLEQELDRIASLPGIAEPLCYSLRVGRRFRPLLAFLACKAVSGDVSRVLAGAVAIELLHKASLIHDDLVDHDRYRRGREAFHIRFGSEQAVVMGDLLFSLAFQNFAHLSTSYPPDVTLRCHRSLSETYFLMCLGEMEDVAFEDRTELSLDESKQMTYRKSVLFRGALRVGAILGGGTAQEAEALGSYGGALGLAGQLQTELDDLLIEGQREGRRIGSDLARGKKTMIITHALAHLAPKERARLTHILQSNGLSRSDWHECVQLLANAGSLHFVATEVTRHLGEASSCLASLSDSGAKDLLIWLVDEARSEHFWRDAPGKLYQLASPL